MIVVKSGWLIYMCGVVDELAVAVGYGFEEYAA